MTKCENTVEFTLRDAALDNMIIAMLEQLRTFPKIELDLLEEVVLVLLRPMRRNLTYS
jgi:hypothetical protein